MSDTTLPRDNLVRAVPPGELRAAEDEDGMPTLAGHFAVFNTPTEINSIFEGRFLERIAPGAFKKTIREQRDDIKVLFQHGHDPTIGDKPLGPIEDLREDDTGAFYEVPLLDTDYNRELVPGLEAGLYGASFRFRVVKEEVDEEPERTEDNPDGIPERTIQELRLYEFGPVTFPAYAEATAGVRSLTDERVFSQLQRDFPERMSELFAYTAERDGMKLDELREFAEKLSAQAEDRAENTTHSDEPPASRAEDETALPESEAEAEPHSDGGSRKSRDYLRRRRRKNPRAPWAI